MSLKFFHKDFLETFFEPDFCFFLTQLDDDIFFGVDNFVRVFPRREHFNQISGFLYTQSLPIRWAFSLGDENYKWICPHWMCPEDIYPPYTGGVGYVTWKKMGFFIFFLFNFEVTYFFLQIFFSWSHGKLSLPNLSGN